MACCLKLMSDNFVDLDILANSDVSSEQAAFPVTNAYNVNRRSKVWRSNGFYKVTSSNNVIRFRDSASTDIDATITVGEYSSTSAFMTAVDTALESAGAANYTITQNSNLKFVITSDLSGGATAFQLRTADAAFTAVSLLGFSTASNLTGASTYTADYIRINSEEYILWDMGLSTNPQNFILIGSRNSPIKISSGATIKLQGNPTNDFTSPEFEQTLTYHDEAIVAFSDTGLHTDSLRYWRVAFTDIDNPLGYLEVGAFFLGNSMCLARGVPQFPFDSQYVDNSELVVSEGGQTFSEIKEQSQIYSIKWSALTKADQEEVTRVFRKYGTAKPFFISFDTDEVFSTENERMTKFVKFVDEPSYSLESPNNFSCIMKFREEL